MGRPKKDDRDAILSVRLGGIVVSKAERQGIDQRVEQISADSKERFGVRTSVASYIRRLIVSDLRAHGCLGAAAPTAAPHHAAPALEPAGPAPPDAAPAVEVPRVESEAEDTGPAESMLPPKPPSATVLRKRIEKARGRGMTIKALADASGVSEREVKRLISTDDPLYPEARGKLQRALDEQGGAE